MKMPVLSRSAFSRKRSKPKKERDWKTIQRSIKNEAEVGIPGLRIRRSTEKIQVPDEAKGVKSMEKTK